MAIHLQDVNESNWRECVDLTLTEEQKAFVDANVLTLAEWKFEPENFVKAIYSDNVLVGMLAYYLHDGDYGYFYWLYHLMIDTQHQNNGYGEAAIKLALTEMRELGAKDIVTNCAPKNSRALSIYKKLGFEEEGKLQEIDIFLRLPENA